MEVVKMLFASTIFGIMFIVYIVTFKDDFKSDDLGIITLAGCLILAVMLLFSLI